METRDGKGDAMTAVRVAVATPVDRVFDYSVAAHKPVERGVMVHVPFGPRKLTGIVLGAATGGLPRRALKAAQPVKDLPALAPALVDFIERVSSWTMAPIGGVAKMVLSQPGALRDPPTVTLYRRPDRTAAGEKLSPARMKIVALLEEAGAMSAADIREQTGVGAQTLKKMAADGGLETVQVSQERAVRTRRAWAVPQGAGAPSGATLHTSPESGSEERATAEPGPDASNAGARISMMGGLELSADQSAAARQIAARLQKGFSTFLLDGVTGSGKTEVYFDAVRRTVEAGRQVLILLPEIALSADWKRRFSERFGAAPTEWHSDVGEASKKRSWREVLRGDAKVVVGARSALFLPFRDLGLVVVDEEHEHAYKQQDQVIYQARDMAVLRARLENCPVVLASATPSLESWVNAGMVGGAARYQRVVLPRRVAGASLPEISCVDLRVSRPQRGKWIAPPLVREVEARLERGEQTLLFLNRRGYAPLTMCGACGYKVSCPNCDAWLVMHRLASRLLCHHCGHETPPQKTCAKCGESDDMRACGPGVERLAEEVTNVFPDANFQIFSSDTVSTATRAQSFVKSVAAGEVDIIIGTQMAAKGHHFPNLTLVGVIDADLGLAGGDLRAAERTFQLLAQVSGRAGREERPGLVMLQTMDAESPVMRALLSGERDAFLQSEAEARRRAGMPPFARLAAVLLSAKSQPQLTQAMDMLGRARPNFEGVEILGPVVAPIGFLRGHHRARALVRADRSVDMQAVVKSWVGSLRLPAAVRLQIDIDPYSFL